MFVPTLATPQFTLVARYLAIAGFALLFAWKDSRSSVPLWIAGLVRIPELLFMTLVALPFLIFTLRAGNGPRVPRHWLFTAAAVGVLLANARVIDLQYYVSPGWSAFEAMNCVRVPFTDYGLSRYYYAHPDVLKTSALSLNDVGLLARWFYPDPRIFEPDVFASLAAAAPRNELLVLNLQHYESLADMFQRPQFLLLFCLAPLLLVSGWHRSPALYAWLTVVAVLLLLYLAGRPGMARAYTPAAAAVSVLMLISSVQVGRRSLRVLGVLVLVLVTVMSAWRVYPRPRGEAAAAELETSLCALAGYKPLAVWGNAAFPYQALCRPAPNGHPRCDVHFYALGTLQLAPYSLELLRRETGSPDLVSAPLAGQEIDLFTSSDRIPLLARYFAEHSQRALSASVLENRPHLHLYALRATGPAAAPPGRRLQ